MSSKNIVVVGGTGYAGSAIVREAARRGHQVTALSRSVPDDQVDTVRYVQGNALSQALDLAGADVVVCALSPRGDDVGALAKAYRRLAAQLRGSGSRLVVVGGFSCLRREEGGPRMIEGESFPPEVPEAVIIEAQENMEVLRDLLAAPAELDWLFVSPAMEFSSWMPGEDLGRYRVGGEVALFDADGRSAISGQDYARAVLDEIEHPKYSNAQIGVAY
jgi:putative NADH-flavin reductase